MSTIVTDSVSVATRGGSQMLDLTPAVQAVIDRHRYREGHALVQLSGERQDPVDPARAAGTGAEDA